MNASKLRRTDLLTVAQFVGERQLLPKVVLLMPSLKYQNNGIAQRMAFSHLNRSCEDRPREFGGSVRRTSSMFIKREYATKLQDQLVAQTVKRKLEKHWPAFTQIWPLNGILLRIGNFVQIKCSVVRSYRCGGAVLRARLMSGKAKFLNESTEAQTALIVQDIFSQTISVFQFASLTWRQNGIHPKTVFSVLELRARGHQKIIDVFCYKKMGRGIVD
jgi:hypothetical protein